MEAEEGAFGALKAFLEGQLKRGRQNFPNRPYYQGGTFLTEDDHVIGGD